MNCQEATIQISLHVGDDLPASEVTALEAHLEHCKLCESEYESYASARDALFSLKDEYSGSISLWEGIEGHLDDSASHLGGSSVRRSWYRHPVFSASMAAALLIGISSPLWMNSGSSSVVEGLAEHAALSTGQAAVSSDVPTSNPVALISPNVETVSSQETLDFLDRNMDKGMLQELGDDGLPVAVSLSDSNRGEY